MRDNNFHTRATFLLILSIISSSFCIAYDANFAFAKNTQLDNKTLLLKKLSFPKLSEVTVKLEFSSTHKRATLSLEKKDGSKIDEIPLPPWLSQENYLYSVDSATTDNTPIILFTAEAKNQNTITSNSYSIVWAYNRVNANDKEPKWLLVSSTDTDDSGYKFELKKHLGNATLIRRNLDKALVCGLGANSFERYDTKLHAFTAQVDLPDISHVISLKTSLFSPPYKNEHTISFARFIAASSSQQTGPKTNDRPIEVEDGLLKTYWQEEVPDIGRGQFLEAQLLLGSEIKALRITPGALRDKKTYAEFAKPTKLLITTSEGEQFLADLPVVDFDKLNSSGGFYVVFPKPIETTCVSFIILDSKQGDSSLKTYRNQRVRRSHKRSLDEALDKSATSTISEITFLTPYYGLSPQAAAEAIVNRMLTAKSRAMQRQLVFLSHQYERPIINEVRKKLLFNSHYIDKLHPLLNDFPADEATSILIPLLMKTMPDDESYKSLMRAITHNQQVAAREVLKIYQSKSVTEPRKVADLIRIIGRVGTEQQRAALIPDIGNGTLLRRNAIVRSVGRCGAFCMPLLLDRLKTAPPETVTSYDILRTMRYVSRQLRPDEKKNLDYEPLRKTVAQTKNRRALLMALRTLLNLTPPSFEDTIAELVEKSPSPLVRSHAAATLGNYQTSHARTVLVNALQDENPDVRIAAIRALHERDDYDLYLDAIYEYSIKERWRTGLTQAFEILTRSKNPDYLTKLESQIRQHPHSEKTELILSAYSKINYPIDFNTVSTIINAPDTDPRVIRGCIDLLSYSENPGSHNLLTKLAENRFAQDFSPRKRRILSYRAILAIGRRDTEEGINYLFNYLSNTSDEGERQTALRALAFSRNPAVIKRIKGVMKQLSQESREVAEQSANRIKQRIDVEELKKQIDENKLLNN